MMKRVLVWTWLWVALVCPAAALADDSPSVISVRSDEWYPVNGLPGAERPGFAIEILRAIFEPQGIRVDYSLSGWSRSLELARTGQVDCVIGAYRADAPALLFPRSAVALDDVAFYVASASSWRYQGLDSLEGVVLGAIADYSYGELMDGYLNAHAGEDRVQLIHGMEPLRRNIRKLLSGRVDVLLESPLVMEATVEQEGLAEALIEAGRIGLSEPIYLACAPDKSSSPVYLRLFDEGMARLRANGELARIMDRYGLPLPPEPAD